jgi:hypothetical protein
MSGFMLQIYRRQPRSRGWEPRMLESEMQITRLEPQVGRLVSPITDGSGRARHCSRIITSRWRVYLSR